MSGLNQLMRPGRFRVVLVCAAFSAGAALAGCGGSKGSGLLDVDRDVRDPFDDELHDLVGDGATSMPSVPCTTGPRRPRLAGGRTDPAAGGVRLDVAT